MKKLILALISLTSLSAHGMMTARNLPSGLLMRRSFGSSSWLKKLSEKTDSLRLSVGNAFKARKAGVKTLTFKGRFEEYVLTLPNGRNVYEFLNSSALDSFDAFSLGIIDHRNRTGVLELTPEQQKRLKTKKMCRASVRYVGYATAAFGIFETIQKVLDMYSY